MAFTNTVATLPGITVPIFVGKLTHDDPTIGSWRIIFFVTIALYIIEIVAYLLLGSGEEQPWNKLEGDKDGLGLEATPLNTNSPKNYKSRDEA